MGLPSSILVVSWALMNELFFSYPEVIDFDKSSTLTDFSDFLLFEWVRCGEMISTLESFSNLDLSSSLFFYWL